MLKFVAKVAPDRRSVAWFPPCGEKHVDEKQNTQNARGSNPKPDQQRNADQQLHDSNHVAEEHRMGQNRPRQKRAIEADRTVRNKVR